MLFKFKAEGAADVLMFGEVAQALLELIGKPPEPKGVITVEQLPQALARLRDAAARDRESPQPLEPKNAREEREEGRDHRPFVSLSQRALPLIGLLEHAQREEVPVVWGV